MESKFTLFVVLGYNFYKLNPTTAEATLISTFTNNGGMFMSNVFLFLTSIRTG
jgi:hypothetical protein